MYMYFDMYFLQDRILYIPWVQIIVYKVIFRVIPCDIRKVPLEDTTVDVAIFCLSLMATDASQFILEANRILRLGGKLLIAEVSSRIENTKKFVKTLGSYGFTLERDDTSNSHFVLFFLKKIRDSNDFSYGMSHTYKLCDQILSQTCHHCIRSFTLFVP